MDANTRRDVDDRDRSGRGGGTGGRSKVTFDKNNYSAKGTQCPTNIVSHLSCNCSESDINSS